MPEEKVESVKGMALTTDGKGAVFDVAAEDLDMFLAGTKHLFSFFNIDSIAHTFSPSSMFSVIVPLT